MGERTVTAHIRRRYRNNVRLSRLRAGIPTVAMLARATGISRSTLSAIEHQRAFLNVYHALAIVECLKMGGHTIQLDDLYWMVETPAGRATSTIPGLLEKLRAAEATARPCPTCGNV